MLQLLLLLRAVPGFLAHSALVTAAVPIPVYGQLGVDLLLLVEEACTNKSSYRFDFLRGRQLIGAYDGELQGLRGYRDLLTYNPDTCTITLRRLRTHDGTTFTVRLYSAVNHKSTPHDINYQITIRDPLTSRPSTEATIQPEAECNGTQASNDGVRSFVSFCLSLDSVVNAGLYLLLLVLQGCCSKMDDGNMYISCLINSITTAVSQICSISTMYNENDYLWSLILILIILIIDALKSLWNVGIPRYKAIGCYLWIGFTLLLQVLFAVLVGLLTSGCDNFSGHESRTGFLVLSLILSALLRTGIFTIIYCCKKRGSPRRSSGNPPDPTLNKLALAEIELVGS